MTVVKALIKTYNAATDENDKKGWGPFIIALILGFILIFFSLWLVKLAIGLFYYLCEVKMSSDKEQTIPFLPTRLNRESSVYGGLSVSEFMLAASNGIYLGVQCLASFVVFALGFDFWLLIPSLAMLFCILSVVIGKVIIARLKRGKPEAYLNRMIEVKLDGILGGNRFISRQGTWSIRRVKK